MKLTVLISSAGRRVELLRCFRSDAASIGVELRVIAADACPELSAACHDADRSHRVPRCDHPGYIERLLEICRLEGVGLVVPTIDTELAVLAASRERFAAEGVRVAVSGPRTIALARDKLSTALFLLEAGVPSPRTVSLVDFLKAPDSLRYPLVVKRIDGSSSIGLHFVNGPEELGALRLDANRYVVQERWQGREYTVNLFVDETGRLRSSVPHLRMETRGGEVSKGRTERVALLEEVSSKIVAALPDAAGALCYQAIVSAENAGVVFEINARFGGGFPLAHRAGARFPLWLMEEALGLPCTASPAWTEGVSMLRYDAAVFTGGVSS